jgi:hypothetical protein
MPRSLGRYHVLRPVSPLALPSCGLLGIYGHVSRVPPYASGGSELPRAEELEQLEELGDDAIIAQQQGAHAPKPRAQVTEDARSVVIADHPPPGSSAPAGAPGPAAKRRERTEKTVVIRDRRQLDELRREMTKRKPKPAKPSKSVMLWVVVGVAAFVTGVVVALLATREEEAAAPELPVAASGQTTPSVVPLVTAEPPSVSIDELPIEGSKQK